MHESFEESLNTSLSLASRARQLLVDIGLKEPSGDPPEIAAQYDLLVDRVANHLREVRKEALREAAAAACNYHYDEGEDAIGAGFEAAILALLEPPK